MKTVIIAVALGTLLMSFEAPAQVRSDPGTDSRTDPAIGTDPGIGNRTLDDPSERFRPDRDRSRSFDLQRDAPPLTSDPRLGPGGSGGPTNRAPGSGGGTGGSGR